MENNLDNSAKKQNVPKEIQQSGPEYHVSYKRADQTGWQVRASFASPAKGFAGQASIETKGETSSKSDEFLEDLARVGPDNIEGATVMMAIREQKEKAKTAKKADTTDIDQKKEK